MREAERLTVNESRIFSDVGIRHPFHLSGKRMLTRTKFVDVDTESR